MNATPTPPAETATPTTAPASRAKLDELAITQVATDGMRLHLRTAERAEAVRRMYGRIDTDIIAWRLYITNRSVIRIATRIGLTKHTEDTELSCAA
ncbi:hypothetical protein ONA92_26805 [Mycobacteroides salmoniphilum]|uniref:hypothetical protein n=1 Tax=Mycobacteroides salmoniphilum TaxID=404941 RepID=UPI003566BAAA